MRYWDGEQPTDKAVIGGYDNLLDVDIAQSKEFMLRVGARTKPS